MANSGDNDRTVEMLHEYNRRIEVMKAFARGQTLQIINVVDGSRDWHDVINPDWNWSWYDYRIKPEPPPEIYCNFLDAEEGGRWAGLFFTSKEKAEADSRAKDLSGMGGYKKTAVRFREVIDD